MSKKKRKRKTTEKNRGREKGVKEETERKEERKSRMRHVLREEDTFPFSFFACRWITKKTSQMIQWLSFRLLLSNPTNLLFFILPPPSFILLTNQFGNQTYLPSTIYIPFTSTMQHSQSHHQQTTLILYINLMLYFK